MAQFDARTESEVRTALLEIWSANERMNQLILEHLDPRAWRAKPPGGKSRTIAAIFSHVHNIRRKWVRLSAPHLKLPAELDRSHLTQKQAKAAFAESANRCSEMLADALTAKPARVRKFHRDGWAPSWPAGPTMLAYMLAICICRKRQPLFGNACGRFDRQTRTRQKIPQGRLGALMACRTNDACLYACPRSSSSRPSADVAHQLGFALPERAGSGI